MIFLHFTLISTRNNPIILHICNKYTSLLYFWGFYKSGDSFSCHDCRLRAKWFANLLSSAVGCHFSLFSRHQCAGKKEGAKKERPDAPYSPYLPTQGWFLQRVVVYVYTHPFGVHISARRGEWKTKRGKFAFSTRAQCWRGILFAGERKSARCANIIFCGNAMEGLERGCVVVIAQWTLGEKMCQICFSVITFKVLEIALIFKMCFVEGKIIFNLMYNLLKRDVCNNK